MAGSDADRTVSGAGTLLRVRDRKRDGDAAAAQLQLEDGDA